MMNTSGTLLLLLLLEKRFLSDKAESKGIVSPSRPMSFKRSTFFTTSYFDLILLLFSNTLPHQKLQNWQVRLQLYKQLI